MRYLFLIFQSINEALKTIYSVFYLWISGPFDGLVGRIRAGIMTSLILTSLTINVLAFIDLFFGTLSWTNISRTTVCVVFVSFLLVVLFFLETKNVVTKNERRLVWICSIFSFIGTALILGETELVNWG